jgi:hypothetical protein
MRQYCGLLLIPVSKEDHKTFCPMSRICQAGTPKVNIQSALRTATDLCTNVSLAVLLGRTGSSYTISKQSHTCTQTHILHI